MNTTNWSLDLHDDSPSVAILTADFVTKDSEPIHDNNVYAVTLEYRVLDAIRHIVFVEDAYIIDGVMWLHCIDASAFDAPELAFIRQRIAETIKQYEEQ